MVDDGSTDSTAAAVAGMGNEITVISQDNRGPGAATTAGFRRVATSFVATLDADDLWLPHKIERQAALFRSDPGVAGVFSLARLFADGAVPDPNGEGAIRRLWTRTTLLFRTEAARAVGDFVDLPGQLGEVIDWLARSRDLGQRHALVEEILALRRIRPGSFLTVTTPSAAEAILRRSGLRSNGNGSARDQSAPAHLGWRNNRLNYHSIALVVPVAQKERQHSLPSLKIHSLKKFRSAKAWQVSLEANRPRSARARWLERVSPYRIYSGGLKDRNTTQAP